MNTMSYHLYTWNPQNIIYQSMQTLKNIYMVLGILKVIRITYVVVYFYLRYLLYCHNVDRIYFNSFWNGHNIRRWDDGKKEGEKRK